MSEAVITLAQLADRLKLHRTTLVRMEQRGIIAKARWGGPPVCGRVYNDKEVKAIEKSLEGYFAERAAQSDGREVVTDIVVAGR